MKPAPLPADLGDVFATARARAAGVSASRLRARDLESPHRGVRSTVAWRAEGGDAPEQTLLRRAREYAARMTGHEFFSHVTAAVLWGLPLPYSVVADRVVDTCVFSPRRNPEGDDVTTHAVKPGLAHVVDHPVLGYRVTTPASTWAMLAGVLPDLYDVVAVADAAVREQLHPDDPPALATVAQLQSAADAGRRRGIARLREALPLISTRSRSRQETRLRLVLLDAGLPAPRVNFDVVEAGLWLAQVDLAYPAQRVAIEYEGDHHRTDPEQWYEDIARVERLIAAGWRVIRVTRADLRERPHAVATRVRRALGGR